MGAGSPDKKQPRPALICKPAEKEEAGLDCGFWISAMQRHPVDPEVFVWMDFALNVNVYNLQLGVDWIGLRILDISNG